MLNGAIGGLVAVTAEPLAPTPLAAIFIGAVGGLIVVFGTKLLFSFKLDDVVGAIPAHMFAGIWGTLAVGIFGALAGADQFVSQLIGVGVYGAASVVSAFIILIIIKAVVGLRVSEEEEIKGLDLAEHSMEAVAMAQIPNPAKGKGKQGSDHHSPYMQPPSKGKGKDKGKGSDKGKHKGKYTGSD